MKYSKILYLVIALVWVQNISAQVTMGSGDPPHKGAVLELKSDNKGFLGPKIQLESIISPDPIQNPAVGLLVFNIGDNGTGENKVEKDNFYFWSGSEWVEFIYEEVLEAEINDLLEDLGIPRSAVFHLNGSDIIDNRNTAKPVLGMFDVMKRLGLGAKAGLCFKETNNETMGNVTLQVDASCNSYLIFKKGTYSITFAYQFIPSANAFPNPSYPIQGCTASSYFVDFPLERSGIITDRARIHNVAYHMLDEEGYNEDYGHHGGAISYVIKIEEDDLPWKLELGAGQSGSNCNTTPGTLATRGFSLMNENTFVLVSRIGD